MVDLLTTSENMFEFNHETVDFQAREARLPKGNMTTYSEMKSEQKQHKPCVFMKQKHKSKPILVGF